MTNTEQTVSQLETQGIHINSVSFHGGLLRHAIYKAFGGRSRGLGNPEGIESMSTQRNPRTIRHAQATLNADGRWTVEKLNFSSGIGYHISNKTTLSRDATFQQACNLLLAFSRIAVSNPPEHPKYGKPYEGVVFGSRALER